MATDAVGIDADAKEAMAFALIAHDSLAGFRRTSRGDRGDAGRHPRQADAA